MIDTPGDRLFRGHRGGSMETACQYLYCDWEFCECTIFQSYAWFTSCTSFLSHVLSGNPVSVVPKWIDQRDVGVAADKSSPHLSRTRRRRGDHGNLVIAVTSMKWTRKGKLLPRLFADLFLESRGWIEQLCLKIAVLCVPLDRQRWGGTEVELGKGTEESHALKRFRRVLLHGGVVFVAVAQLPILLEKKEEERKICSFRVLGFIVIRLPSFTLESGKLVGCM